MNYNPQWTMDPGPAGVEIMSQGRVFGSGNGNGGWVTSRLRQYGWHPSSLRTFETLEYDDWKKIHDKVQQIYTQRLVAVGDLMSAGLTVPLENPLGTTMFVWQDASDMEDAHLGMAPQDRGLADAIEYGTKYLPLPLVYKRISLDVRQLESSRRNGQGLDVSLVAAATRKVAEKIEEILVVGTGTTPFAKGGGTIYGYKDFTYRNTGSLTTNWDESGAAPVDNVVAMKQAAIDARRYGPYSLYVPTNYETPLDEDYDSTKVGTVRERLLKISGINSIKVIDKLTADNVILVSLDEETVQMITGFEPQVVEWDSGGGFYKHFIVFAMMVPWLKADQENRSGVVHYS